MSNIFNYHHRPSKSIERKLIMDLLRDFYTSEDFKKCIYVGLGSFFFIDFKLMHKTFGIKKLINIEWDEDNKKRYEFNKPFSCIELKWGSTTEVLPTIQFDNKAIVWLDYTDSFQPYMLEDVEIVSSSINPDSFFIISLNSQLQKYFNKTSNQYNTERFAEDFGDDCLFDLEASMLTNTNSYRLFQRMINEKINQILNLRNAGLPFKDKLVYEQLLLITYKDGAPMFTTGGVFLKNSRTVSFRKRKLHKFSFIRKDSNVFDLHSPVLSSQEIDLLNASLPNSKHNFLNKKALKFIPEEDRIRYFENYRYFPSYVEIRD